MELKKYDPRLNPRLNRILDWTSNHLNPIPHHIKPRRKPNKILPHKKETTQQNPKPNSSKSKSKLNYF